MSSSVVDIVSGGTEDGEALISIHLLDGKITVKHGDYGDTLLIASVEDGFWNSLWAYLEHGGKTSYRCKDLVSTHLTHAQHCKWCGTSLR